MIVSPVLRKRLKAILPDVAILLHAGVLAAAEARTHLCALSPHNNAVNRVLLPGRATPAGFRWTLLLHMADDN